MRSGATSTKSSSAVTRASSGASIRRSCGVRRGARSGADESRRSLLHRYVPAYAAGGLHAHVRADARSPRTSASRSVSISSDASARSARGTSSTPGRSTRTSTTVSASCRTARSSSATSICRRAQYQAVGTVNFPNDHDYTRITEFRHLTGQWHTGTSIVREYPCDEGDPYYPVPRPENEALFKRYEALAQRRPEVTFVGRLAQYRYYNMDQCVGAAFKAADNILSRLGQDEVRPAQESTPRVRATASATPTAEHGRHDAALPATARTGAA